MNTPKFKTHTSQLLWEIHYPSHPDGLVGTKSLANILHLAPSTLEAMRSRGGGPEYIRIRGRVFYDLETAIRWFEDNMEAHQ